MVVSDVQKDKPCCTSTGVHQMWNNQNYEFISLQKVFLKYMEICIMKELSIHRFKLCFKILFER